MIMAFAAEDNLIVHQVDENGLFSREISTSRSLYARKQGSRSQAKMGTRGTC